MLELREGGSSCFPKLLVGVNVGLALVAAIIALLAFCQLIRIHSRNSELGWTRQKVFHLMIGSSNMGYFIYFVLTLIATCKGWPCWSNSCGFILMAFPKILFFAAFLLLLSFWVDLCHQANDEDDEDEDSSSQEALLDKTSNKSSSSKTDTHRKCFPLRFHHVGSRQKIVMLVTVLVFVIMLACAVIIWIGMGKNSVDSALVTRVYVDFFSIAILLLGGALACYGLLLCLKMSKVRSERASSEMWKVSGLAVVSVICFTSSSFVALLTDIPMLYHLPQHHIKVVYTSLLLILYHFIGSSAPSAFILWIMRELPPLKAENIQEASTITFIADSSAVIQHPQRWTTSTSLQNQISRVSPI
ncbi:tobamovirus multiplication protein 1 isoform X2 [Quercus suber]|uniref:tobamovirus multiplication protein 1 isoform X1 n=1 Tax=Quercus suber TaxID=58331 RepID=UPI000CE1FCDB|nr:tobamovirus multiplication protein 1-like [Quercus suber]POF02048.1 tobamovirus multiplication protein 1 [Quercus suber]POF02049.1 tobamovirus multiplication protein 1 [Quercus suber]